MFKTDHEFSCESDVDDEDWVSTNFAICLKDVDNSLESKCLTKKNYYLTLNTKIFAFITHKISFKY